MEIIAKTISSGGENYPTLLKQIYKAPEKLFYRGDIGVLEKTCISIVGTRRNSEYGEEITKKIVEELSILDIAIVSGLAKGIDAIAHKAALENNLPTIAVLGSGIENIYPGENKKLAEEIEKNGLILSEYEANTEPVDFHFPQRNRIVSGLSIATIVIEAPEKSGALITARYALEQGREIFVVPGDIDRQNSIGTLRLLQRGAAYPISSGEDVIEMLKKQPHLFKLNHPIKPNGNKIRKLKKEVETEINLPFNLSYEEKQILSTISPRRNTELEKIIQKLGISISKILATLSVLEIKGLISKKDGKYCRKC